ncbi:HD-GYP domain-containing protein (c-di-GMP phosphodiesterase class II) [Variovorax boronicumulans]|uniref:HD domain-containing phosphohydrolase n=1 Tax=Variovorax boronicumulans TaxID=436515 RepID=UPI002785A39F|nr:HD domain-containing phosphohydrolase [Variovorax boronicumulans]MDP9991510.1 HD-GYP domain-containing protein (c-di-GMP phosphodiesterase class II) [Variovorax boronicumulans]MDQ0003538.1 HD-GYP domain-containing protein (c-di-GMP phosphodiesterase class II) [Variovorax boronicumulans]
MPDDTTIAVFDAVRALAFIGDLSMGQPTDHSLRTAWLAGMIATEARCAPSQVEAARHVALLRWSGCTANAQEFADFLDDDVQGRQAMLASQKPRAPQQQQQHQPRSAAIPSAMLDMANIHCEIAGDIANTLGLLPDTEAALRAIFETYDGGGVPGLLQGDEVPLATYVVALASDLEIFSRLYGLDEALTLARGRANSVYPGALVDASTPHVATWMKTLNAPTPPWTDAADQPASMLQRVGLELVGDVIDLKLPWMTGYSRRVAQLARDGSAHAGLDEALCHRTYKAGLIHGIGRASVPNAIWNAPEPLPASSLERMRLVPYWTSRAAGQIDGLAAEAEIASFAFERRDGSGYFRGRSGTAMPPEAQFVAAAERWVSLRTRRPWRAEFSEAEALGCMKEDVEAGRFDQHVVDALLACAMSHAPSRSAAPQQQRGEQALSERELEVLRCISKGENTKEVARALGISPRTVRTHVERVFLKLECSTRAAATLKAATRGLI